MNRIELKRMEGEQFLGPGHDFLRGEILKDEKLFEAELVLPENEGAYYTERTVLLDGMMVQDELVLSLRERPDELNRFSYFYAPITCTVDTAFVKSGWKIKGGDTAFMVRYGIVGAMLSRREEEKRTALKYVLEKYGRLTEAEIMANPQSGDLLRIILLREGLGYDFETVKSLMEPRGVDFRILLIAYFFLFNRKERS